MGRERDQKREGNSKMPLSLPPPPHDGYQEGAVHATLRPGPVEVQDGESPAVSHAKSLLQVM